MRVDVLIFGGGASGLWCLDRFHRAGYVAVLLEAKALGAGQTIQAQGIIHGGGKYALRGVRDFASVRTTSEMPERWRRCLSGADEPSLEGVQVLSQRCYLWLPRGSLVAKAQSWGVMSVVGRAGLLASRPVKVKKKDWPETLRHCAAAIFALSEQVISTGSFLKNLAALHENHIFLYDATKISVKNSRIEIGNETIEPRVTVLTAGSGNAELLRRAGIQRDLMQLRPLKMVLLRGPLPPLYGHCVIGGKTQLTITAPVPGVWQVGGEIAELLAHEDDEVACQRARREIHRWIPELDLSKLDVALYNAVRAEARTSDFRRPSGVHASYVAPGIVAAWPTKLCLAPVLADDVFTLVSAELKSPAGFDNPSPLWPKPSVAPYPWENAEWFNAA
ncbi:MAG: FAD-dependent oxidoreductase [Deltaproteobacteria bacterium]|nr:FAD-dependent oxidoreductase [Deltaproteobacteria bacterium]